MASLSTVAAERLAKIHRASNKLPIIMQRWGPPTRVMIGFAIKDPVPRHKYTIANWKNPSLSKPVSSIASDWTFYTELIDIEIMKKPTEQWVARARLR